MCAVVECALAAMDLAWARKDSFLSRCTPNHLSDSLWLTGRNVWVALFRLTVMGGFSLDRRLVRCSNSVFPVSKVRPSVRAQEKRLANSCFSILQFARREWLEARRQMSSA